MSESIFNDIDCSIGDNLISGECDPITPEIIDEAARIMLEKHIKGLSSTCPDFEGVIHHTSSPRLPDMCINCGWVLQ